PGPPCAGRLLRVELDDQLLLDGQRDVRPPRPLEQPPRPRRLVHCQPRNRLRPALRLQRRLHGEQILRGRLDPNLVARPRLVARDVDDPAVHLHVPVPDELPRLLPARRKAHPVHHVVQASLQRDQQVLTRHARLLRRTVEQVPEVPLGDPVDPLDLLLLPELLRVVGCLAPPRLRETVLPRRVVAPLDRALLRVALRPLQEQLLPLAAAKLADRTRVASHVGPSSPLRSCIPMPRTSSRPTVWRFTSRAGAGPGPRV